MSIDGYGYRLRRDDIEYVEHSLPHVCRDMVIPGRANGSRERAHDDRLHTSPESIGPHHAWTNGFQALAFGEPRND
ncbi:MAG TPA: hypothetical protein DEH75_11945, partial [Bradyrhizobium sp.]|nr:hypothetical protein [Bradyrhizobium sp.]